MLSVQHGWAVRRTGVVEAACETVAAGRARDSRDEFARAGARTVRTGRSERRERGARWAGAGHAE